MRNLIKVLTVLGWCLLGVVIGAFGVQAGTRNGSGTDNSSNITNLLTVAGVGDSLIVTTASITSITSTTASSGGHVTVVGAATVAVRGVCWSTSANPTTADSNTTDGTGAGSFTSSITGLSPGTLYHVRAYAVYIGAAKSMYTYYGGDSTFTALTTPTVTTASITSITSTTASSGGNVTDSGGVPVTARGVCWSTSANPTTSDSKTTNGTGTGAFTSSLTSLTPGILYHVRAYATNSVGTSYGGDSTFTTLTTPTVTTATITSITSTTASSGGDVTSDGGASVTARGVCWSTSANPTTSDSKTTNGTGTGAFTSSLTSLTPGTLYHVRAYATNSVSTSYGGDSTFTTLPTPTITTTTITPITCQSATSGGNITSDGGDSITARGVCWGTSANPVSSGSHTVNNSDTGSFVSSVTGLTPNTLYHVRAYATNSGGTSYGGDSTFTTLIGLPTVTTKTITAITSTTASGGGNVTSACGDSVTARGVCWGTSVNPVIGGSHTVNASDTGSFISSLTGLDSNTTYYVRAYATNSVGTGYGNQVSFTTLRVYTISGHVRVPVKTLIDGIDSVTMSGLPGNPKTDSTGYYTATVDSGWSGTVKPAKTGYSFSPDSTSYTDIDSNQETNYTGTFLTFTISGYVLNSDSVGVDSVLMSGLPGNPRTDTNGYYTATVDYGWSGTVTPTDSSCTFEPESRSYDSVTSNQTDQNYAEGCLSQGVDPDKKNMVPGDYSLTQNYPNPFNPATEIDFGLPQATWVSLKIYNIVGQEVTTLISQNMSAGSYRVRWNGTDKTGRSVSSGVYFYRIRAGDHIQTKRMLLLK
ncbi:MAG: T9SS type A sorting domain-containing protein [Candidatus Zixiibacteriota bacterium]